VAWLGPAPAHANDAFAGLHALGEGLVAAAMGPSQARSARYLTAKRSMTSARAALSLGSRRMNRFARIRFLRSMSTAISPGLGLPGAPARLLPRRIGARRGAEEGKGAGAFRTPPLGGVSPRRLPSGRRRPSSRPRCRLEPRRLSSLLQ